MILSPQLATLCVLRAGSAVRRRDEDVRLGGTQHYDMHDIETRQRPPPYLHWIIIQREFQIMSK